MQPISIVVKLKRILGVPPFDAVFIVSFSDFPTPQLLKNAAPTDGNFS